jgi:hypothetical protein
LGCFQNPYAVGIAAEYNSSLSFLYTIIFYQDVAGFGKNPLPEKQDGYYQDSRDQQEGRAASSSVRARPRPRQR